MQRNIMPQAGIWFLVMTLFCLTFYACSRQITSKNLVNNREETMVKHPPFEADSAMKFAIKQVSFGPRIPNSEAQKKCADYLKKQLEAYAPLVQIQEFTASRWDGVRLKGYNIIASFNLDQPERILLAAHWDSRPYADNDPNPDNHKKPIDGANDGASGVAVLMEAARVFYQKNPAIGVDIIFFDLEDSGCPSWAKESQNQDSQEEYTWCLGSQYWAENPHIPAYNAKYGILLDMVGVFNPYFTKEATSMYYASDIMNKVWNTASILGYGSVFSDQRSGGMIDDHLFINKITGIPMIDIIHYQDSDGHGFFKHWHTVSDNLENLSPQSMKIVGEVILNTIYNEKI
ncbi:MAG: M28 family peptidase [Bacteroidales bacterium]